MKIWNKPTAANTSTPSGANILNDLADVAIATPVAGQIIKYDGSTFINAEVPGLTEVQAQFDNLNANNLTSGIIPYPRLPNLAEITLSGDAVPPYIESITPITPSGTQTIEIIGEYFSPITQLSIPGVIVNDLEVRSPGKIIASISKSGLSGNIQINLSNGLTSNQAWLDGIKLLEINPDPYWANTLLLIKGQGVNGSTNIINEKTNTPISVQGNTAISNIQSKYGGSSIKFDGSGDFLEIPNFSVNISGDFTVEAWVYLGISNNYATIFAGNVTGNTEFAVTSSMVAVARSYVTWDLQFGHSTPINTWNHFAFSRQNGLLRIFKNGQLVTAFNYALSVQLTNALFIGKDMSNTRQFNGYLSHIRYSDIARYTGAFDPESDTYLN